MLLLFCSLDSGRPGKRPRNEELGSSSESADHPTLAGNIISNISNAGLVPFVDYVQAHRDSFIIKVRIQDCTSTIVGREEERYDFDDIGRVLGNSFLIAYFDTHKENLTWAGQLMFKDIEVSHGRIVVNRKPTVATSPDDFDKDIHVLVLMLRATFLPRGKNLPYFEGFLRFIEKSNFRNQPELLPYKRRPLVFMSPVERGDYS